MEIISDKPIRRQIFIFAALSDLDFQILHGLFGFRQPHTMQFSVDIDDFDIAAFFDHFDNFCMACLSTFKIGDVQCEYKY